MDGKTVKTDQEKKPLDPEYIEHNIDNMIWVGIGASAGGLEALSLFVANLPKNENITYIVAQHLSPDYKSMMVELLARETHLNVAIAQDNLLPKPNTIYISPPSNYIYTENNRIKLRAPLSDIGPKPSVNYLFNSLAEEYKERAVGVILSGTGSDGTHGVRSIKANGGIVLVQTKDTAKYDGMPASAIDTGCTDLQLPPDKIAEQLTNIVKYPRDLSIFDDKKEQSHVQELMGMIKRHCNVDFTDYKQSTLTRRIERRMAANGASDVKAYLDIIKDDPTEIDRLFSDILISVTSFFRDKSAFDDLRETIGKIMETKSEGDTIRIWVAGCATGEEVYSIAILFSEYLGGVHLLENYNFQIFATDLDADALNIARKGVYSEASILNIDKKVAKKYFKNHGSNYMVIKPIRDLIVFSYHNLIDTPPFLRLDLVSCRNLLIYFNSELQARVFRTFHYSLGNRGYLFLGKSETLGKAENLFIDVNKKSKIFRASALVSDIYKRPMPQYNRASKRAEPQENLNDEAVHQVLVKRLIKSFAPNSILINDGMDIKHIYGDVSAFLRFPDGEISYNLVKLSTKDYKQEVRALVYRALRENNIATGKIYTLASGEKVQISVLPLIIQELAEKLLLVNFQSCPEVEDIKLDNIPIDNIRFSELEQELNATREHLQTVIEELETSNEELQSTNEELQSANEELQSSNEELETSNEELQSTNEELTTVNEEMQVKSNELSMVNGDLEHILESIDFPLIVLDGDMRVTHFNKPANKIFDFIAVNIGQVITTIKPHYDIPHLHKNIQDVLSTGAIYSQQIDFGQSSYWHRILPKMSADGQVQGLLLTFISNSEIREKELKLQTSNQELQDFSYVVSHDLQAPLRTIVGLNARIMKMRHENMTEEEKRFSELVQKSAEHMQELVEGVLLYSRVVSRAVKKEYVNTHDTLDFVLKMLNDKIIEHNIIISADNLDDVYADPIQLRSLLQNIVENAIKYRSPKRAPKVEIRSLKKADHIEVQLKDNGIGIKPERLDDIFTMFKQLHTKEEYEGIGAGLTICKRIVGKHGGQIWATSNADHGTTFHFTLPHKGMSND